MVHATIAVNSNLFKALFFFLFIEEIYCRVVLKSSRMLKVCWSFDLPQIVRCKKSVIMWTLIQPSVTERHVKKDPTVLLPGACPSWLCKMWLLVVVLDEASRLQLASDPESRSRLLPVGPGLAGPSLPRSRIHSWAPERRYKCSHASCDDAPLTLPATQSISFGFFESYLNIFLKKKSTP